MKRDTITQTVLSLAPSLEFMGETTQAGQTMMESKPQYGTNLTPDSAAKVERVEEP